VVADAVDVRGWITRREYDAHCDKARWQADDA